MHPSHSQLYAALPESEDVHRKRVTQAEQHQQLKQGQRPTLRARLLLRCGKALRALGARLERRYRPGRAAWRTGYER